MDWIAAAMALGWILLGWLLSLLSQRQQHKFELERFTREQDAAHLGELRARGEQLADEILDILTTLLDALPRAVYWSGQEPDPAASALADEQLRTLARLMIRVPDEAVRSQLELAHALLSWPDDVVQWGDSGFGSPRELIWVVCQETLDVVGRYVRGEPQSPASNEVRSRLETAQENTCREMRSQWEDQDRRMRGQ